MNEVACFHRTLTRSLLLGSAVVFAAGAAIPALGNFWGMSLEEGLVWIAANPGKWAFSSIAFIASLILCVAGLAIFNQLFQFSEAQPLSKIGFYTFLIGAILWIIVMGFHLSLGPWAAKIFVETSSLPDSFTPLSLLESSLFDILMVSTFLASSIYGIVLLKAQGFPNSLGWFSLVYGLFGAAAYAITGGPIPGMVLVVPLALGLSPYSNTDLQEQQRNSEKPLSRSPYREI